MAEIIFGDFIPEEKLNEYVEVVQQLADLNDENKSVTLVVDVNESQREQLKFQRAANNIQKTARLRVKNEDDVKVTGKDEDGNDVKVGTVKLVFTLTKMHKGRRGAKPVVEGESADSDNEITDEEIAEFTEDAKSKK
jgi:hypothetical protein